MTMTMNAFLVGILLLASCNKNHAAHLKKQQQQLRGIEDHYQRRNVKEGRTRMMRKPRQPSIKNTSLSKPSMTPMNTVKKTLNKAEMAQLFSTKQQQHKQQQQQQHKHDCTSQKNCFPGIGNHDSKQTPTGHTGTPKQKDPTNNTTTPPYEPKTKNTMTNSNDTDKSNDKKPNVLETMFPNKVIPTKGKKRKRSATEGRQLVDIQKGSELSKNDGQQRSFNRLFSRDPRVSSPDE